MYILRQFEIIIICMPLIFRQSMQKYKKNEIIQSFARFLAMPAPYYYK